MFSRRLFPLIFCWCAASVLLHAEAPRVAEQPKVLEPGSAVELVAQEPQIRTPTAVQVDSQGRIWVLENNTHFRPKNYDAPPTDRVLIMDEFSQDGRAGRIEVAADGFRNGMGLRLLPGGDAIVSTRAEVFRLHGKEKTTLLTLTTADDYPHNGLSGMTLGPDGAVYVGLGENHGTPWKATGSDGATVEGSDEGAVFRFDQEGKGLEHWAKGFWNPFGLAFDDQGRLFALDNDPGAGSLCRLLYVVHHGDYGFRYRYGRTAEHPFLSWYGQIPGTLPIVCLVGEAPTGLLPQGGELLGCTWDDHGIQRFVLKPKGASFTSEAQWFVHGGYYFRPTGLAQAPDGSLVFGDWVDGAYEVHGKGSLWRVRRSAPVTAPSLPRSEAERKLQALLEGKVQPEEALPLLASEDPYLVHGAIEAVKNDAALLKRHAADDDAKIRLGVLLAARRSGRADAQEGLASWLGDADGAVRRAALQWIAEENLQAWKGRLESVLAGQPSSRTFQAYLAALQMLISGKPDPKATASEAVKVALDPARPAELRALALRLIPLEQPELTIPKLRELLGEGSAAVRLEAIRILAARSSWEAQPELRRVAADAAADPELRAEALAGLGKAAETPENAAVLRAALAGGDPKLQREAARSLKALDPAAATLPPEPSRAADPHAGRRVFFHPNGPRCYTCHSIEGRGGAVGPDLTTIFHQTPEQLLTAIREPSKEIAPAFLQWSLTMKDGSVALGIDQFEDNKSQTVLIDATGKKTHYQNLDIVKREALPISMMPPGLENTMTPQELADLIAYLRQPRD